jgi:Protein of unknown function (DUF4232)
MPRPYAVALQLRPTPAARPIMHDHRVVQGSFRNTGPGESTVFGLALDRAIRNDSNVLAPPKIQPPADPEALIPEARDRQRRRRLIGAASLAVAAGLALALYAGLGLSNTPSRTQTKPSAVFAPCRTPNLSISLIRSGAAAGTVGGWLAFKNRGSSACTLHGWPKLTAFRQGASSTARHVESTMFGPNVPVHGLFKSVTGIPRVTLRHGQTAVAVFTGGDIAHGPAGDCPPAYRHLRVTPPANSASAVIPAWIAGLGHNLPDCTPMQVSMVVPASDLPRD